MNKRQKIIVSITGIFIVLLALVGLTYAYFLTRINGNEKDKSISVTTANLELVYGDDDGSIIGEDELIEPDTTFETKTFTVTNNGNSKIDNYAVILDDVKTYYATTFIDEDDNEIEAGTTVAFKRPQDFEISIECSSLKKDATETTECYGYTGTLPLMESETLDETYITNGILTTNSIEEGEKQTYSVVLKYKEANTDQSDDMNKVLDGKFNIIDANNTVDITGALENATGVDAIVTNSVRRESQINSDGSYKIVGLEADVHSIKKKVGTTETEIGKLSVVKGKEASVGTTTLNGATIPEITITDLSREANIDINITSNNIKLNSINNSSSIVGGTLVYNIINNGADISVLSEPGEFVEDPTCGYGQECLDNVATGCPGVCYKEGTEKYSTINTKKIKTTVNLEQIADGTSWDEAIQDYTNDGLFKTEDDYGISYYYRGPVTNNYVTMGTTCWRIVRIAGDGSIKLVLEDKDNDCKTSNGNWNISEVNYGYTNIGGTYKIDFLNSNGQALEYEKSLGTSLKTFQVNNVKKYLTNLKSGDWCFVDKAYTRSGSSGSYTYELLEDNNYSGNWYYDTYVRFNEDTTPNVTLKCNGTKLNKWGDNITDMYVGALTVDEVIYAGSVISNTYNSKFYLVNSHFYSNLATGSFWTFSPTDKMAAYTIRNDGRIQSNSIEYSGYGNFSRPVINLSTGISSKEGIGTKDNPYVIG